MPAQLTVAAPSTSIGGTGAAKAAVVVAAASLQPAVVVPVVVQQQQCLWSQVHNTDPRPPSRRHGHRCVIVPIPSRHLNGDDFSSSALATSGNGDPMLVDGVRGPAASSASTAKARMNHSPPLAWELMMLWGGCNGLLPDIHSFDLGPHRWKGTKNVTGDAAALRPRSAFACTTSLTGKVYIFGGINDRRPDMYPSVTDELIEFDNDTLKMRLIHPRNPAAISPTTKLPLAPSKCASPTAVFVPYPTPRLIIQGGIGERGHSNDVHVFDLATESWIEAEFESDVRPPRLDSHSAVLVGRDRIMVFGGVIGNNAKDRRRSDDVYFLHLLPDGRLRWEAVAVKGPRPAGRSQHSALLMDDRRIVVFGGWTEIHSPPIDRSRDINIGLALDPEVAADVLAAAAATNGDRKAIEEALNNSKASRWKCTNDLWIFDCEARVWELRECKPGEPRPSPRAGHSAAMIYNQMVVFGGLTGFMETDVHVLASLTNNAGRDRSVLDDTWVVDLGPPPPPCGLQLSRVGVESFEITCVDPFRYQCGRMVRFVVREVGDEERGVKDGGWYIAWDGPAAAEDLTINVNIVGPNKLRPNTDYEVRVMAYNISGETPAVVGGSGLVANWTGVGARGGRVEQSLIVRTLVKGFLGAGAKATKPLQVVVQDSRDRLKLVWEVAPCGEDLNGGSLENYLVEFSVLVFDGLGHSNNLTYNKSGPFYELHKCRGAFCDLDLLKDVYGHKEALLAYRQLCERTLNRADNIGIDTITGNVTNTWPVCDVTFAIVLRVRAVTKVYNGVEGSGPETFLAGHPSDLVLVKLEVPASMIVADVTGNAMTPMDVDDVVEDQAPRFPATTSDAQTPSKVPAAAKHNTVSTPQTATTASHQPEPKHNPDRLDIPGAVSSALAAVTPTAAVAIPQPRESLAPSPIVHENDIDKLWDDEIDLTPLGKNPPPASTTTVSKVSQASNSETAPASAPTAAAASSTTPAATGRPATTSFENAQNAGAPAAPSEGVQDMAVDSGSLQDSAADHATADEAPSGKRKRPLEDGSGASVGDASPSGRAKKAATGAAKNVETGPEEANDNIVAADEAAPSSSLTKAAQDNDDEDDDEFVLAKEGPEDEPEEFDDEDIGDDELPDDSDDYDEDMKRKPGGRGRGRGRGSRGAVAGRGRGRRGRAPKVESSLTPPSRGRGPGRPRKSQGATTGRGRGRGRGRGIAADAVHDAEESEAAAEEHTESPRKRWDEDFEDSDDDEELSKRKPKVVEALKLASASSTLRRQSKGIAQSPTTRFPPPSFGHDEDRQTNFEPEEYTEEFLKNGDWNVGDPHAPWYARLKYGKRLNCNKHPSTLIMYARYQDSDKVIMTIHYEGYSKSHDDYFDVRDPTLPSILTPQPKHEYVPGVSQEAVDNEVYDINNSAAQSLGNVSKKLRELIKIGEVVELKKTAPKYLGLKNS